MVYIYSYDNNNYVILARHLREVTFVANLFHSLSRGGLEHVMIKIK